jgi:hypothetical protein
VSVWRLLGVLVGFALRGRGGYRVYVVVDGLPEAAQIEVDECDLAVMRACASGHPFVVLAARHVARPGG